MKNCAMAFAACLILTGCQSGCGTSDPGSGSAADSQRRPLPPIPTGISFGEQPPDGYSDIILFADGRLGAGDVSDVATGVAAYVEMFDIVILANVERDQSDQYGLEKVGIGFSMLMDGRNTVVTVDSQEELGADLDMIASDVLSRHEGLAAGVRQVARDAVSMIVDVPTLMLHQDEHRMMTVRYLIRVSPDDGRVDTVVWQLGEAPADQDHLLVEDTFEHLPPNMREDRVLNVDGGGLTFGIPSNEAFAAVSIARGTPHVFTDELRKLAGRVDFDESSYRDLLAALADALGR